MSKIKKYKTISILVILIIFTALFGLYIKSLGSLSKQNPQSASVTPTKAPDVFLHAESLNLPSSYMGFVFSKLSPDKNILGKSAFYYDNKQVSLEGTEWVVKKSNVSEKEYESSVKDFETFSKTQLQELDWVINKTVGGHKFSVLLVGVSADNLSGYLKITQGKIQVILLQTKKDKLDCPCNLEFRIFVSNISELSKVLK